MDFSPSYGDFASTSNAFDGPSYRPSSSDGLYPPVSAFSLPSASATARTPSPLSTYTGAVAPFSQLPFGSSIMPFGSAASYNAPQPGSSAAGSSLAMQAAIHQQQRSAFLNPRSVELSATQGPATITPTALTASQLLASASASSSASSTPPPAPPPRKTPTASSSTATATKKARAASPAASTSASSSGPKKVRAMARSTASPAPSSARSEASPDADPVVLWAQALPDLRSHLTQRRLTSSPLSTAQKLVRLLSAFSHTDRASSASRWGDASDVPPEGRAEVLTALIRYAKDDFWKAWLEVGRARGEAEAAGAKGKAKETSAVTIVSDGLELLQVWLDGASKAFVKDKDGAKERERDRKRKELEQASLALVLQVRFAHPLRCLSLFSSARWFVLREPTSMARSRMGRETGGRPRRYRTLARRLERSARRARNAPLYILARPASHVSPSFSLERCRKRRARRGCPSAAPDTRSPPSSRSQSQLSRAETRARTLTHARPQRRSTSPTGPRQAARHDPAPARVLVDPAQGKEGQRQGF